MAVTVPTYLVGIYREQEVLILSISAELDLRTLRPKNKWARILFLDNSVDKLRLNDISLTDKFITLNRFLNS